MRAGFKWIVHGPAPVNSNVLWLKHRSRNWRCLRQSLCTRYTHQRHLEYGAHAMLGAPLKLDAPTNQTAIASSNWKYKVTIATDTTSS